MPCNQSRNLFLCQSKHYQSGRTVFSQTICHQVQLETPLYCMVHCLNSINFNSADSLRTLKTGLVTERCSAAFRCYSYTWGGPLSVCGYVTNDQRLRGGPCHLVCALCSCSLPNHYISFVYLGECLLLLICPSQHCTSEMVSPSELLQLERVLYGP